MKIKNDIHMRKLFSIVCFLLIISSCEKKQDNSHNTYEFPSHDKIVKIKFPHVLKLGDTIKGELEFNIQLDSVYESKLIKRFTFLYVTTENLDTLSAKSIQGVNHRAFVDTLEMGKFKFEFYPSSKRGEIKNLSLVVQDVLLLKPRDTMIAMDEYILQYPKIFEIIVE